MKLSITQTVTILAIFSMKGVLAKIFDKCSLAHELVRLGFQRSELPDWVCLAEHESSFNTQAVGAGNSDGSLDYGLFQINDRYWCQPPNGAFSHNGCGLSCNDLLTDSIEKAVTCARLVESQQGLPAWVAWNKYCQVNKPNADECF